MEESCRQTCWRFCGNIFFIHIFVAWSAPPSSSGFLYQFFCLPFYFAFFSLYDHQSPSLACGASLNRSYEAKGESALICFKLRHAIISSNILAVSSLPVIPPPFEAATLEPVTAVNCCSVLHCPMPVKHFFSDDVTFIQSCSNRPSTIQVDFFSPPPPLQSLLCRSRGERRSWGIPQEISSFSYRQPSGFGKTLASTIYPSTQGI